MVGTYVIQDNTLISYKGNDVELTLPEVAIIGSKAFQGNSSLRSVTVPPSVKTIGDNAFQCCYSLERIMLPEGLIRIGKGAFNNSPKLTSVDIPDGVTEIPDACFFACSSLSKIKLPSTLMRIGCESFEHCALSEVIIPDGVEEIDSSAFSRNSRLTRVVFPASLKRIGPLAFAYCKYLPMALLNISEHASVATDAFNGCCQLGYKKIRCLVDSKNTNHQFTEEISTEIELTCSFEQMAQEIVEETICDNYEDVLDEAVEVYKRGAGCKFSLATEGDKFYSAAIDYIVKSTSGDIVTVKEINETKEIGETVDLPITEILIKRIKGREECESYYCDIGGVIEDAIRKFEEIADWHFGLRDESGNIFEITSPSLSKSIDENGHATFHINESRLEPVLWYGLRDQPENPWIISETTTKEEFEFWFADADTIMNTIIDDCDDSFLIWYFCECGRETFDMSAIRDKCPLTLDSEDSLSDVLKALKEDGVFKD